MLSKIKKFFRYAVYGVVLGSLAGMLSAVVEKSNKGEDGAGNPLAPDANADFTGTGPGGCSVPGCSCSPCPTGGDTAGD